MDELICMGDGASGCVPIAVIMGVLISAFHSILFLQSGFDKVFDRKGNIEWLTGHFAKSPFKNVVPLMVTQITIMEIAAGALCGVGGIIMLLGGSPFVALLGTLLASVSLICLFLGQRMAKDYDGAGALVPYFLLAMLGLYVLTV